MITTNSDKRNINNSFIIDKRTWKKWEEIHKLLNIVKTKTIEPI